MDSESGHETGTSFVLYRFYEDFNEYPLSNSQIYIAALLIIYLAFVLKIGPYYMKDKPPYTLKNTILIYNVFQVIISVLFVYLNLKALLAVGFIPRTAVQNEDPNIRKMMFIGPYIYLLGKFTELLDTIFFVLRKKYSQVSCLHVYHHSSVLFGTWLMVFYSTNATNVFSAFINSLVHVVMYFYYFLAALGPQYQKYLTWKRHMTTFQLVQFVSIFAHQAISLFVTKGEHTIIGTFYFLYSAVLYFVLFSRFYNATYKKPKPKGVQSSEDIKSTNETVKNQ